MFKKQTLLGNIQVFEWHPSDPAVLVAGLANGQLVHMLSSASTQHPASYSASCFLLSIHTLPHFKPNSQVLWDLSPHLDGVEKGACTWDHR